MLLLVTALVKLGEPLRLVKQSVAQDNPKAISCYGLYLSELEETWLRFVDGHLVSGITTQLLEWRSKKLAGMVPEALDELTPVKRHIYSMLRLMVTVQPTGILEVSGTFGAKGELSKCKPTPESGAKSSAKPSRTESSGT